jgi:hypothetical protein
MEKTGILRTNQILVITLLLGSLWLVSLAPAWSGMNLAALDDLSAADKYRQLNLILMVSEGVDAAFVAQLLPQPTAEAGDQLEPLPQLKVEDFQTPLNRIVDQRAMITQAARLFRFTLDNKANIMHAMEELAAAEPGQIAQVDLIQLAEDAIIIRSALSGSIEYLATEGNPAWAGYLQTYQNRTLYLRNVMEYWKFDQELASITNDAMEDTGGRMEAYQRMLEAEPNLLGFKQHLQAIEAIYKNTQPRKIKPRELESKELIDEESQVDH